MISINALADYGLVATSPDNHTFAEGGNVPASQAFVGNGWIADTAECHVEANIDSNSEVGEHAIVGQNVHLINSRVLGNAVVLGGTFTNTTIKGRAFISGNPSVTDSTIQDDARAEGTATITSTTLKDRTIVRGGAILSNCTLDGDTLVDGICFLINVLMHNYARVCGGTISDTTISGDATVEGSPSISNSFLRDFVRVFGNPVINGATLTDYTWVQDESRVTNAILPNSDPDVTYYGAYAPDHYNKVGRDSAVPGTPVEAAPIDGPPNENDDV